MAVRIRLKRFGRKNRSFFRLGVFHSGTRRDGRAIEELGWYDPLVESEDDHIGPEAEVEPDPPKGALGPGARGAPGDMHKKAFCPRQRQLIVDIGCQVLRPLAASAAHVRTSLHHDC